MLPIFRGHTARIVASLGGPVILLAVSGGVATAQDYPREVIAHCARMIAKMPEVLCITCEGFDNHMRNACEANGGRVPGSRVVFGSEPWDTGPTAVDRLAQ
jgi:hypothetical protein